MGQSENETPSGTTSGGAKPSLLERMLEALDDGLINIVKDEQKALANRLGADATFTNPQAECAMAERGMRNAKAAHDYMRLIAMKVFAK